MQDFRPSKRPKISKFPGGGYAPGRPRTRFTITRHATLKVTFCRCNNEQDYVIAT